MANFYTNLSNFLTGFNEDSEASTKRQKTLNELRSINIQLKAIDEQLNTKTSLTDEEVEKLQSKKEALVNRQNELNEVKDTYNNTGMANTGRYTKNAVNYATNNSNVITEPVQAGAQGMFIGLGNWAASNRAKTTAPDRASAHLQQQATMHDVQSGDLQKNAQQAAQIANRDYHTEAEKNAVAGATTENAQRVQNLSASAGAGAAALNRQVKSADYNTMMNRADTQRDKAVQYNKEAWDVRQVAEQERAGADRADYFANEANTANRYANLALGAGYGYDTGNNTEQNPANESNPEQTVSKQTNTETQPENTGTQTGTEVQADNQQTSASNNDWWVVSYTTSSGTKYRPYKGELTVQDANNNWTTEDGWYPEPQNHVRNNGYLSKLEADEAIARLEGYENDQEQNPEASSFVVHDDTNSYNTLTPLGAKNIEQSDYYKYRAGNYDRYTGGNK